MTYEINLSVPAQYRPALKELYFRSVRKNLFSLFARKDRYKDMVEGFRQRYKTGQLYGKYLDGVIDWYLNPLYHCEAEFSLLPDTPETFALDLGCGAGSVGYWLRNNDYQWSYMGVDLIEEAKTFFKPLSNATFLQKNVKKLELSDLPQKADIIFSVNMCDYIPNLENLLAKLHDLSTPGARLVIIDGHNAPFWNRNSIGNMHSTKTMKTLLERQNWHIKKIFKTSVFNVANIPILEISHGFLCTKTYEHIRTS